MYSVYYTNHGFSSPHSFETAEEAVNYGKDRGFEFTVRDDEGNVIAGWTVFGGLKWYSSDGYSVQC